MEGFFGIGIQELILIAIVALIVLGPERLPATFREIAKFIRYVRNLTNEFTTQFGDDFKALEDLDPRRMLQREIESIDAEENKGKPATTKPATTTAKPKPATATTAKTTTTTTTPKPATSTTTTKSTTSSTTAKPATAQPATETNAATVSTAAPANSEAASTETPAVTAPATTSENRIAPPPLTTPAPEQSSALVGAVTYNGSSNGVAPKENEATAAGTETTNVAVATNGAQAHSTPQSEQSA
ncbi:MAG: twin-arginine translocase subunit TatB [Caldilinea sp. CFX5]|nr:twin-arginine translocase subunit TatB [Caldilinea sp. CFX5]